MTTVNWQAFNWLDFAIIGLLIFSTLVSLARGFVREALSLASWIVALLLAYKFSPPLAIWLTAYVKAAPFRLGIAFLMIFIGTLIVGALVNYLFGQLIMRTGLTGTDRVLGLIFGAARGILLVAVLILIANFIGFTKKPWWNESQLIPQFQDVATWLKRVLPEHTDNLEAELAQPQRDKLSHHSE